MRDPFDPKRNVTLIDLETIRDTLIFIRDDLQRLPELARAAALVNSALAEIETAERRRLKPIPLSLLEAHKHLRRKH